MQHIEQTDENTISVILFSISPPTTNAFWQAGGIKLVVGELLTIVVESSDVIRYLDLKKTT